MISERQITNMQSSAIKLKLTIYSYITLMECKKLITPQKLQIFLIPKPLTLLEST